MEIVLNSEVVFASPKTTFRFPEVLRGGFTRAGALPRCMLLFGNQRTMDLFLTGRILSVDEAERWGLVKEIVPQSRLLDRATEYTAEIASLSQDSVTASRLAVREAWETDVSRATTRGLELWSEAMLRSKNAAKGPAAYREKREPKWLSLYL